MTSDPFKSWTEDQLSEIPDLLFRRMFGGHGIYSNGLFFGLIPRSQTPSGNALVPATPSPQPPSFLAPRKPEA